MKIKIQKLNPADNNSNKVRTIKKNLTQNKNELTTYDRLVGQKVGYRKMTNFMISKIRSSKSEAKILEIGIGTGLFSQLLSTINPKQYVGIEIDKHLLEFAKKRIPGKKLFLADGVVFKYKVKAFDWIAMTLVYHHIEPERKLAFIKNCFHNLETGGEIVIGDVFIPEYSTILEWKKSLVEFHKHRLTTMKDKDEIHMEKKALKDGLNKDGEWKTCISILIQQLEESQFSGIHIYPISQSLKSGGYYVVVAKKT